MVSPARRLPQSHSSRNPIASPTKANAVHGKIGKSQGWGSPKLCTPLTYDSSGHGRKRGLQLVHIIGVSSAMAKLVTTAVIPTAALAFAALDLRSTSQHITAISIIEIPMIF